MKFFLDTADTGELREAAASGLVDGITTNPTLIAKTGRPLAAVVEDLVSIVDGPISVETISLDAAGMVDEGRRFAAIHKNIVVKCPLTREGLKATKLLTSEGHKVNVTLCFSAMQALLARCMSAYPAQRPSAEALAAAAPLQEARDDEMA